MKWPHRTAYIARFADQARSEHEEWELRILAAKFWEVMYDPRS